MSVDNEEILEHCPDVLDAAANLTLASTANKVAHHSFLAAPEQVRDADGNWATTECVDCGEDIEEGRLELAKVRCFRCQQILENKRRGNFRVSK